MTPFTILLIAALVAAGIVALIMAAVYLYDFVTNDGYGHLSVHATPPRSHYDTFGPRPA